MSELPPVGRDGWRTVGISSAAVFMVSLDEPEKNKAFAESLGTTQVLLSDTTGTTAEAYGVHNLYTRPDQLQGCTPDD